MQQSRFKRALISFLKFVDGLLTCVVSITMAHKVSRPFLVWRTVDESPRRRFLAASFQVR